MSLGADVCNKCHSSIQENAKKARFAHAPITSGNCVVCHAPHGSNLEGAIKSNYQALCFTCHDETEKALDSKDVYVHTAVYEGRCNGCHTPHFSEEKGLIKESGRKLCLSCHFGTESIPFKRSHGNINVKNADCLGCHEPHAAADKRLLYEKKHLPFETGDCAACHDKL